MIILGITLGLTKGWLCATVPYYGGMAIVAIYLLFILVLLMWGNDSPS